MDAAAEPGHHRNGFQFVHWIGREQFGRRVGPRDIGVDGDVFSARPSTITALIGPPSKERAPSGERTIRAWGSREGGVVH
jgi:hypothetical protein